MSRIDTENTQKYCPAGQSNFIICLSESRNRNRIQNKKTAQI